MSEHEHALRGIVEEHARGLEAWEWAELHLLQKAARDKLAAVGVRPTRDVALALMAIATLLGEHAPEWGGDARAALAEVALVALDLTDDSTATA